jgi:hypothetical protein
MVVQDVQQQIVKAGGFLVMDEVDVEAAGPMPARCLSCNADKDGFYLCTICFELNLDHSCELFEELQDAWNEGKRDFPRPGKNAKEMYKK